MNCLSPLERAESRSRRCSRVQPSKNICGTTRELVAGCWLWEVKDMDEAVAWACFLKLPMIM